MGTTKVLSFDVGIKNLSFTHFETHAQQGTRILDWQNISVTEENCKKIKLDTLTECMLNTLIQIFDETFETDIVLIENQPMLKNGNMKTMAVVIYTYFNVQRLQYGHIREVKFISASNKLKCLKSQELESTLKEQYKDRKKLGVEIAKLYLPIICPERLDWFTSQKKKDDVCDSFCQGIYFMEHVLKHPMRGVSLAL